MTISNIGVTSADWTIKWFRGFADCWRQCAHGRWDHLVGWTLIWTFESSKREAEFGHIYHISWIMFLSSPWNAENPALCSTCGGRGVSRLRDWIDSPDKWQGVKMKSESLRAGRECCLPCCLVFVDSRGPRQSITLSCEIRKRYNAKRQKAGLLPLLKGFEWNQWLTAWLDWLAECWVLNGVELKLSN